MRNFSFIHLFIFLLFLSSPVFAQWFQVGTGQDFARPGMIDMLADPVNNEMHIAYPSDMPNDSFYVKKYDGFDWVTVGKGFVGSSSYDLFSIELAFDPITNEPNAAVGYVQYTNGFSAGFMVELYRFDGTDWTRVGSRVDTSEVVTPVRLEFNPQNHQPEIAFVKDSAAHIRTFNGQNWVSATPAYGFDISNNLDFEYDLADNSPMLVTQISSFIRVEKFDGSNWVLLGDSISNAGLGDLSALIYDTVTNSPILAYRHKQTIFNYTYAIVKFDGTNWNQLGSRISNSQWTGNGPSLAISPLTNEIHAMVINYDSTPETYEVFRFDGSNWQSLGTQGLTVGGYFSVPAISFLNHDSIPYIFYNDFLGTRKFLVKRYSCAPQVAYLDTGICDTYISSSGNSYTATGVYFDSLLSTQGCDSIVRINLEVISNLDTTVTLLSNGLIISGQTNASYQWLDCNNNFAPIAGSTSQSFFPFSPGSYSVKISLNGCVDTSECIVISSIKDTKFSEKIPVKYYDVCGRETPFKLNTILIILYNDGTREKKFFLR